MRFYSFSLSLSVLLQRLGGRARFDACMFFCVCHQFQDFVFAFVVRVRVQQLLPCSESLIDVHLALPFDDAQIEQRIGLVRLVRERFLEFRDGGVSVTGVPIGRRHVSTNARVGWLYLQRALVVIDCGGKLLGVVIDVPNVFEKAGVGWVRLELLHQRRSLRVGHFLHLRRSWSLGARVCHPDSRSGCARCRSRGGRWTLRSANEPAASDSYEQADHRQHVRLHACPLLNRRCPICIRHFSVLLQIPFCLPAKSRGGPRSSSCLSSVRQP